MRVSHISNNFESEFFWTFLGKISPVFDTKSKGGWLGERREDRSFANPPSWGEVARLIDLAWCTEIFGSGKLERYMDSINKLSQGVGNEWGEILEYVSSSAEVLTLLQIQGARQRLTDSFGYNL